MQTNYNRLKLVIFLFFDLPACNKQHEILSLATALTANLPIYAGSLFQGVEPNLNPNRKPE